MERIKVIPPQYLGVQLNARIDSVRYIRKPDMALITVVAPVDGIELEVVRKVFAKETTDSVERNRRFRDMLGCRDVSNEIFVREIGQLVRPDKARYDLVIRLGISDKGNQYFFMDSCSITQLTETDRAATDLASMITKLRQTINDLEDERIATIDNYQKLKSLSTRLMRDYEELRERYEDVVQERDQLRRKLGMEMLPPNLLRIPNAGG